MRLPSPSSFNEPKVQYTIQHRTRAKAKRWRRKKNRRDENEWTNGVWFKMLLFLVTFCISSVSISHFCFFFSSPPLSSGASERALARSQSLYFIVFVFFLILYFFFMCVCVCYVVYKSFSFIATPHYVYVTVCPAFTTCAFANFWFSIVIFYFSANE